MKFTKSVSRNNRLNWKIDLIIKTALCVLLISAFFLAKAFSAENDVLKALEQIRGHVESGVTFLRYTELLANARTEINILERKASVNPEFLDAAHKCLEQYTLAAKLWEASLDFRRLGREKSALECEDQMREYWHSARLWLNVVYLKLQ